MTQNMETYEYTHLKPGEVAFNETNVSTQSLEHSYNGIYIPLYIYIITIIVNAIIFIVGTFGNMFVIYVILRVQNMRTATNVFLLNLSAADVLVLLVCQPAGLVEFFGKDRWFLGKAMCKHNLYHYIITQPYQPKIIWF